MEPKRLCRASIDKKICGVCGGIAHYFDVDSNLIRLITAALMLAGGLSIWLYIIPRQTLIKRQKNPERQAFRILSYLNQFRLKPVGVDAHIAPANGTGFTGISGEFEAAQGRTESSAPTQC